MRCRRINAIALQRAKHRATASLQLLRRRLADYYWQPVRPPCVGRYGRFTSDIGTELPKQKSKNVRHFKRAKLEMKQLRNNTLSAVLMSIDTKLFQRLHVINVIICKQRILQVKWERL